MYFMIIEMKLWFHIIDSLVRLSQFRRSPTLDNGCIINNRLVRAKARSKPFKANRERLQQY